MTIVDTTKSLQLLVDEVISELSYGEYPMLSRLTKRVISQKTIKYNVNVNGAGVTGEATSATVSSYTSDSIIGASLGIGSNRLRHSFSVQKEDIAEARAAGAGALRDLFGYEVQSGVRALMEVLSGKIYTGTGIAADGGVVGLETVFDATASYAGIDPVTYTEWVAAVNTNGANRALTLPLLVATEAAMGRKGATFTAVYTTPEIVAKYKELFAANAAISNTLPAGQADLGFTGLSYAGRPIIQDPYCPNNKIFFINESQLSLYSFSQNNTSVNTGVQVAIDRLPSANPDAENYVVYVKPQLKVDNRKKVGGGLFAITQ
jgi:hypothetical protein